MFRWLPSDKHSGRSCPVHRARYPRLYPRASQCAFLPHANVAPAQRPATTRSPRGKYPARDNARRWKIAFVKRSRNTRRIRCRLARLQTQKAQNRPRRSRIRNSIRSSLTLCCAVSLEHQHEIIRRTTSLRATRILQTNLRHTIPLKIMNHKSNKNHGQ